MTVKKVLQRMGRIGSAVETGMLVSMLGAIILIGVGQIILREAFGTGIAWADELVRIIVLWLAMVGSVAACRENRHIRIDALSHVLPEKAVILVRVVVDLFAAFVVAVIAFHAWRYLQIEVEYEVTVLVDTPAWLAHFILPLAFALMAYRFTVSALQELGNLFFAKPDGAEQ